MRKYEKPIVLVNDELFEGVFAASGAVAGGNVALSVSASIAGSNGSDTCYLTGKVTNNTAADVKDWRVQLTFNGTITSATVYNCNASINGSVLTITPAQDYNRTIAAGGFAELGGAITGKTVLSLI